MTPRWDDGDAAAYDDEITKATKAVHRWAEKELKVPADAEFTIVGASYRMRVPTVLGAYVAEVRGQSSVTGHGRQGSHPARIAFLRDIAESALVIYAEGASPGATIWWGWLDQLPDPINIDNDPAHRRMGWWCREMERSTVGAFRLPARIPDLRDDARLFG